jgi:predicted acetyltransferase
MPIDLDLAPASEQPRMAALFSAYLDELGQYGAVGATWAQFESYWRDADRRAYFIRRGGDIVGFAWVNAWSPSGRGTDHAVAEFYVVPQARRDGVGLAAAAALFARGPGRWELGILPDNAPALAFWPKAVAAAGGRDVEMLVVDGEPVLRFRIGRRDRGPAVTYWGTSARRRPPAGSR